MRAFGLAFVNCNRLFNIHCIRMAPTFRSHAHSLEALRGKDKRWLRLRPALLNFLLKSQKISSVKLWIFEVEEIVLRQAKLMTTQSHAGQVEPVDIFQFADRSEGLETQLRRGKITKTGIGFRT